MSIGKLFRKLVPVIATFFVPYAAPAVASALGVSGTLGSLAVRAGLGAGMTAIAGGDPRLGAIGGALTTIPGVDAGVKRMGASVFPGAGVNTGLATGTASTGGMYGGASPGITGFESGVSMAATPTNTFMNALSSVPAEITGRFSNPTLLADMFLKGGAQIAAGFMGALTDDGRMQAQQDQINSYLAELQQRDRVAYNALINAAKEQVKMAGQFNPQYYGQLAENLSKHKSAFRLKEMERDQALSKRMSQGDKQRLKLAAAREEETARQAGVSKGIDFQTKYLNNAAKLYAAAGSGGPGVLTALTQSAQNQYLIDEARQKAVDDYAETMGSWFGTGDNFMSQSEIEKRKNDNVYS